MQSPSRVRRRSGAAARRWRAWCLVRSARDLRREAMKEAKEAKKRKLAAKEATKRKLEEAKTSRHRRVQA